MRTAGTLDHLFTLQRPDTTAASGYTDVPPRVWGSLAANLAGSDESMRGGGPAAITGQTIVIYHRQDVRASWRLVDVETGAVYEVRQYGDPDGGRTWLQLMVAEVE